MPISRRSFLYNGLMTALAYLTGCGKSPTKPNGNDKKPAPEITSFSPEQTNLTANLNDKLDFNLAASVEDNSPITYEFLKNSSSMAQTKTYSWTVDRKGSTNITGIAKANSLEDRVSWSVNVENRIPFYNQIPLTEMNEESSVEIELNAASPLSTDPGFYDADHDVISYTILSVENTENPLSFTETGITTLINNSKLSITGKQDFHGKVRINVRASDGSATKDGSLEVKVNNLADNPNIIINGNLSGTIDTEYSLSGENSKSPDGNSLTGYLWEKVSGPDLKLKNANTPVVSFNLPKSGTYKLRLTVTDSQELTSSKEVDFTADSYKVLVSLKDPLLNEGISGLKVNLNNKSVFTNGNGTATLEYKTQSFTGNLTVDRTSDYAGILLNSISVSGDKNIEEALFPLVPLDSTVYSDLLEFMRDIKDIGSDNTYTLWQELPIKFYKGNQTYEGESIDSKFEQARRQAISNWENKTFTWKGRTITPPDYFVDVDSDPTLGIRMNYNPDITQFAWDGDFGGERGHAPDGTPRKGRVDIDFGQGADSLDGLTKLFEHEIRHGLHDSTRESKDRNHISNPSRDVHVSKDDSILTVTMYKLTDFYKTKGKFPDLRIHN